MKSNFFKLVETYKNVLRFKRDRNVDRNIRKTIINLGLSTFVVVFIFALVAYLFESYESIHFVFISVNIILLCSFLIFKLLQEGMIKSALKQDYSIFTAVHLEVVKLIAVLSIANALFIFIYIQVVVSSVITIVLLGVGIISTLYIYNFESNYKPKRKSLYPLLVSGVVVGFSYAIVFYLLGTSSITMSYILSTMVIVLLYLYKTEWEKYSKLDLKMSLNIWILLALLFIPYYYMFDHDTLNDQGGFLYAETNHIENLDFGDVDYHFVNGDNLYVKVENRLFEYSNEYKLLETYEPNIEDIVYFTFLDDTLLAITSIPDEAPFDNDNKDNYMRLYDISDVNNPVVYDEMYIFDFPINLILEMNNELVIPSVEYGGYNAYLLDEDGFPYSEYENSTLYEDEYNIIYTKNGYLTMQSAHTFDETIIKYSNYYDGKALYKDQLDYLYVTDFEDFVDGKYNGTRLDVTPGRVTSFLHKNNTYYLVVRSFDNDYPPYQLFVLNSNGKVLSVSEVTKGTTLYKEFFITETVNDGYQIIDQDNIVTYYVSEDSYYLNNLQLIMALVLLLLFPSRFPNLKGSELDE